jgi:hypothetical protein
MNNPVIVKTVGVYCAMTIPHKNEHVTLVYHNGYLVMMVMPIGVWDDHTWV